jgi:hypothetical protein
MSLVALMSGVLNSLGKFVEKLLRLDRAST